jgi:hypothetical protein
VDRWDKKTLINRLLWYVRAIIWLILFSVLGIFIAFFTGDFIQGPPGLFLGIIATIAVAVGTGVIIFGISELFYSRFMKIWAIISLILGTYISFSFSVRIIHDPIGLLVCFTSVIMGIFGGGVIASILPKLLLSAIEPIKMKASNALEKASRKQYGIILLLEIISFLLFAFTLISFSPIIEFSLKKEYSILEYMAFLCPFCPFSYAQQIGVYPGLAMIGILFGLFIAFELLRENIYYHLERGKPIVLTRRDFLSDIAFFCSSYASLMVLMFFFTERNRIEDVLCLGGIYVLFLIYYISKIRKYPWILAKAQRKQ